MKKSSSLYLIGILAVVVALLYSGYLYYQKTFIQSKISTIDKTVAEYQKSLFKYESERVLELMNADKALISFKSGQMKWSEIIKNVLDTLPKKDGKKDLVEVLSYSATTSKDINMSVRTAEDSDNPYLDVADLIQAFDESKLFADSFVPSISGGINLEGKKVLSFMLNTKYTDEKAVEVPKADLKPEVKAEPKVEAPASFDQNTQAPRVRTR
ncbi:MAG: hypothetical protein WC806_00470 [Candidatus Gracilibacteria bacterium]|jgi:hypothetical protein